MTHTLFDSCFSLEDSLEEYKELQVITRDYATKFSFRPSDSVPSN